jgi:hypothetical protein
MRGDEAPPSAVASRMSLSNVASASASGRSGSASELRNLRCRQERPAPPSAVLQHADEVGEPGEVRPWHALLEPFEGERIIEAHLGGFQRRPHDVPDGYGGQAARVLAVVLAEADRLDGRPPKERASCAFSAEL